MARAGYELRPAHGLWFLLLMPFLDFSQGPKPPVEGLDALGYDSLNLWLDFSEFSQRGRFKSRKRLRIETFTLSKSHSVKKSVKSIIDFIRIQEKENPYIINKIIHIGLDTHMKKILDRLFSKKGVIILGILTFIYLFVVALLFTVAGLSSSNPAAFGGRDFSSLRRQVISSGKQENDPLAEHDNYGGVFYETTKVFRGKVYYIYVSGQDNCSNYIAVMGHRLYDEYGLALAITISDFLTPAYQKNNDFILYAEAIAVTKQGTPYKYYDYFSVTDSAAYFCSINGELILDHPYEDTWEIGVKQSQLDEVNQKAEGLLKDFFVEAKMVIESFGVNPDRVFAGIKRSFAATERGSLLLGLAAVLSVFGGPVSVFFGIGLAKLLIAKKKNRLIKEGIIKEEEEDYPLSQIEVIPQANAPPTSRGDATLLLDGPVERFCNKTHIRPVLGEWVIRGLGLALITIGAVFMQLINKGLVPTDLSGSYAWFKMINSLGQFLLVVALIGIIAETRRGLTLTASGFMALAVTYYLAVNSAFYMFDTLIRMDFMGISFTQLLASMLPGNLFMSMGLFTFIGFFLFEEPPEWLIKRKVFRCLSAIPTCIALMSVILSILWTANVMQPNYWVSSFFFVRDFDGLIIGLLYIYIIFFFRTRLRRKYGKDNADVLMERPSIQFQKNMALCLVVIVYAIIFYCLPQKTKSLLDLPDHTLVYALVPIFLFYKPAGVKRKMISNIIYYVLYALSFVIPTVVTFAMQ